MWNQCSYQTIKTSAHFLANERTGENVVYTRPSARPRVELAPGLLAYPMSIVQAEATCCSKFIVLIRKILPLTSH